MDNRMHTLSKIYVKQMTGNLQNSFAEFILQFQFYFQFLVLNITGSLK